MDNLIGKTFFISGMTIEVVADKQDKWECRNTTTRETIYFDKQALEQAIKLGKAEEI